MQLFQSHFLFAFQILLSGATIQYNIRKEHGYFSGPDFDGR